MCNAICKENRKKCRAQRRALNRIGALPLLILAYGPEDNSIHIMGGMRPSPSKREIIILLERYLEFAESDKFILYA